MPLPFIAFLKNVHTYKDTYTNTPYVHADDCTREHSMCMHTQYMRAYDGICMQMMVHICVLQYLYVYVYVCVVVSVCVCVCMCSCVCMCMCMYVYLCLYVYVYVCVVVSLIIARSSLRSAALSCWSSAACASAEVRAANARKDAFLHRLAAKSARSVQRRAVKTWQVCTLCLDFCLG